VSKTGKFIISFDCEGKWGSADHITDHHCQMHTNRNLNKAYQRLVDSLDKRQIKSTFAFVAAFIMSAEEYHSDPSAFRDVDINGNNWLTRFREDVSQKLYDGWFNPEALEIVKRSGNHEIGCHGFSHLPLAENLISREDFCQEMASARQFAMAKNLSFRTLIYPRNLCGYTDELSRYGFVGYRTALYPNPNKLSKISGLLSEFNCFQQAQTYLPTYLPTYSAQDAVVEIPPAYFLNWRAHVRKKIPIAVSLMRWKSIIRDAVKNSKVVHLSSHPHNFIDGDRQYQLFEGILDIAVREIDKGNLISLTQEEYCNEKRKLK